MQLSEATISLHLGNDGVDEGKEIVLSLAHQHTDFTVGEKFLNERSGEARVVLHVPRSLGDFCNHYVGIALGHLIGDFLVLLIDDDSGMGQVLIGEFLIKSSRVHHHTHLRFVEVGQRLVVVGISGTTENGLAVNQVAVTH